MTRNEILDSLQRIEGYTTSIKVFDNIEDQTFNHFYTKEDRIIMLIRMKEKISKLEPKANGTYYINLALPRLRSEKSGYELQRTNFPVTKPIYDLVLVYIDECINQLRPRNNKPIKPFRDALLLENKDEFIKEVKPHLKTAKSFTQFYYTLMKMAVISEMDRNEARLVLSSEFGSVGSKQYFSRELKRLIESKPVYLGNDEKVKIDRFRNIISRYTPDTQS